MADTSEAFKVVVCATVNGIAQYFNLDLCRERSISTSMSIAQFPIQNGNTASDHMYRNPTTLSISGSFSLNSKYSGSANNYTQETVNNWFGSTTTTITKPSGQTVTSTVVNTPGELKGLDDNRLKSIQTIFDYIQKNGIFCSVFLAREGVENLEASSRFKLYHNMVLRDITWIEKLNSMDFNFTFQEVILYADALTSGDFEWIDYNTLYPSPLMPATKTLAELRQGNDDITVFILKTLVDYGYLSQADVTLFTKCVNDPKISKNTKGLVGAVLDGLLGAFLTFLGAIGVGGLVIGAASAVGTFFGIGAANAWNPVGWVLLAIGTAIALVAGTALLSKANKKKNLKNGFQLIRNFTQYIDTNTLEIKTNDLSLAANNVNQADVARLIQLLRYVKNEVSSALSGVKIYQITTDTSDNGDRQLPITVGSETVVVQITSQTVENPRKRYKEERQYSMSLYDLNGNSLPMYCSSWPIEEDLSKLNRNDNVLYVTLDLNYEMYLFHAPDTDEDVLANYFLIVCYGKLQDHMKKIKDTIIDALKNQGFTK